jgi:hypothetical protein
MRWSWIHWRCQFHTSAGTKYSLTISWSTGTIFAVDLWISSDIAFLTIHCVSHDSIFAIDSIPQLSLSFQWWFQGLQWLNLRWRFIDQEGHNVFDNYMRQAWLYFCYRFHPSAITQFSVMISRSTGTLFSLTIYGSAVILRFCQFHESAMTLFLLSIWCIVCEFSDAVDSIRRLSLSIHWWFQGLQLLCFRRQFMDQPWHSIFGQFHAPARTLFFISIGCVVREFNDAVDSIR